MFGQLTFQVGVLDAIRAFDGAVEAVVLVVDLPPSECGDLLLVRGALGLWLIEHLLDVVREDLDGLPGRGLAVFLLECGDLVADGLSFLLPSG